MTDLPFYIAGLSLLISVLAMVIAIVVGRRCDRLENQLNYYQPPARDQSGRRFRERL